MNGFAAVHEGDGAAADPARVRAMLAAIAHRGRGAGGEVRQDGSVALGALHGLAAEGPLTVVADARLDNRPDLARELGLDRPPNDAGLILAAYRRWGQDCASRLLGDFAFAVHDAGRRRLYCARDGFGVRPLHYARAGTRLLVASEPKALLAAAPGLRKPAEIAIANFLVGRPPEGQGTFYEGIETLPAAHWLLVEPGRSELRRYWRLERADPPRSTDFAEQFRAIFVEAVRRRLDDAGPVAAMLSGGLDSSSIASVAAPIHAATRGGPLPTYSLVFDRTPEWNERPFIEAVTTTKETAPCFIESGDHAPFDDFARILAEQDGPFLAPILSITRQIHRRAAADGIEVLLDGHGGDEVVSHGAGRLGELVRAGRWLALWREVRAAADTYHSSPLSTFIAHARLHRPTPRVDAMLRRLNRPAADGGGEGLPAWRRLVNPDLSDRTELPLRAREAAKLRADPRSPEAEQHVAILNDPLQSYAFTVLDRNAAAAGIELRFPFWDRSLLELCIGLPAEEKLADGWSRLILRRALEGILPPKIQWRRDKLDFAPHLSNAMVDRHRDLLEWAAAGPGELGAYMNLPAVRASLDRLVRLRDQADGMDVQAVWRTVSLALWLESLS